MHAVIVRVRDPVTPVKPDIATHCIMFERAYPKIRMTLIWIYMQNIVITMRDVAMVIGAID